MILPLCVPGSYNFTLAILRPYEFSGKFILIFTYTSCTQVMASPQCAHKLEQSHFQIAWYHSWT